MDCASVLPGTAQGRGLFSTEMRLVMKLVDLLEGMEYQCIQGEMDREFSTLVYDSRKVEKDSVFVCINGAVRDGHDFAGEVV